MVLPLLVRVEASPSEIAVRTAAARRSSALANAVIPLPGLAELVGPTPTAAFRAAADTPATDVVPFHPEGSNDATTLAWMMVAPGLT